MNKINVLVVEDESIVAKDIQNSLKRLGYNVVGVVSTGEDAIAQAKELKPDLILMDIMLKGELSGIDASNEIKKTSGIPIVFLTAYADETTFSKAKESDAFAYIIKPFKEIDLHNSIEIALHKFNREKEVRSERDLLYQIVENKEQASVLFIKSNSKFVKLKSTDIFFVEALKDYVSVNTKLGRFTIHSTMKDIQVKLPNHEFIRVHRSFIVRIDKIATIDFPNITIEDEKRTVIPIGGSYKDELYEKINML